MGASLIEEDHIGLEQPRELLLVKDQEVIQAFSSHAPQKAFTHGIRDGAFGTASEEPSSHSLLQRAQNSGQICDHYPESNILELVHTGSPPAAVRDPGIGRSSCHIHMNDPARLQLNDEESKHWTEEEIHHLQEITSPDVFCMIAQECFPGLATDACWASLVHILLNRPFTHPNIQLE